MAGIDVTKDHDHGQEQFKAILGGKYGKSIEEATERALDRMQGKGREL